MIFRRSVETIPIAEKYGKNWSLNAGVSCLRLGATSENGCDQLGLERCGFHCFPAALLDMIGR